MMCFRLSSIAPVPKPKLRFLLWSFHDSLPISFFYQATCWSSFANQQKVAFLNNPFYFGFHLGRSSNSSKEVTLARDSSVSQNLSEVCYSIKFSCKIRAWFIDNFFKWLLFLRHGRHYRIKDVSNVSLAITVTEKLHRLSIYISQNIVDSILIYSTVNQDYLIIIAT